MNDNLTASTSPSIYANFRGMVLGDACGSSTVETLMLSFSSGELSSIEGNFGMYSNLEWDGPRPTMKTKPLNFRDLPCPPQSVMV